MIKSRLFVFVFFFAFEVFPFQGHVFAQEKNVFLHPHAFYKKFFPKLKIKHDPPDSSYIKLYPKYLAVGMHVLSPAIGMNIKSRSPKAVGADYTSKFRTNVSDIIGFSASYKFISVGFAFLLKSGMQMHSDYAPSSYRTATIKYNSGAYVLQFKYLKVRGFTDVNQFRDFDPAHRPIRRPDMVSKELQFEGIYNFSWRKYSYLAPLTFSQRQVKSRIGFLLKGGVYYNQIAGDSTIINQKQQPYYENFDDVRVVRTLSLKLAPGIGGNLVFLRRLYLSLAVFTSFDLYFYKYLKVPDEKVSGRQTFAFVSDGKASLGYQSKRLYAGLRYEAESRAAVLRGIKFNSIYTYIGVEFGYRFKSPHLIKKIYKETMPPGM